MRLPERWGPFGHDPGFPWQPRQRMRDLDLGPGVSFRRIDIHGVEWIAPMGTADPWPDHAVPWTDLSTGTTPGSGP